MAAKRLMSGKIITWYAAGVVIAVLVGWLAAQIHATGHAPIGLTSIGVGIVLGVSIGGLAAMQRINCARSVVVGAVVFSLIAIIGEHTFLYRDFCRQWQEQRTRSAAAAMFPDASPPSPVDWMRNEWHPLLWAMDAVLITISCAATAVSARRYRIVVSDPVDPLTSDAPPSPKP